VKTNEPLRPAATESHGNLKIRLDYAGMLRLICGCEINDYARHFVADPPARVIVAFVHGLDEELPAEWLGLKT
jgi:hypothetical protein